LDGSIGLSPNAAILDTGNGIAKGSKTGRRNQTFGVVVLVLDVDVLLRPIFIRILETVVLHVRIYTHERTGTDHAREMINSNNRARGESSGWKG
jgi:hypothetical protein